MPFSISELCDIAPDSEGDGYISARNALGYPIIGDIGYGGFSILFGLSSACRTIEDQKFHPHSCIGHFLGFARTDRPLRSRVERVRTSRAFITCHVEVWQKRESDQDTAIISIQVDFHRSEPLSFPPFSAVPRLTYKPPEQLQPVAEYYASVTKRNGLPLEMARNPIRWFKNYWDFIETRDCPEGVGGQNLNGQAKHLPTSQDHLPIAEKVSADWIRLAQPLEADDARKHYMAVAFALDFSVAFTALMHDKKYIDDVSVNSSLDFALRFFGTPDMNEWMLREQQSYVGGNARSYSEYRLFDQKGNLFASMTQQSLIRPKKAKM